MSTKLLVPLKEETFSENHYVNEKKSQWVIDRHLYNNIISVQ